MRRAFPLLMLLSALSAPAAAQESPAPGPALSIPPGPAVQNRKYRLRTELALGGALLPTDAYSKEAGIVGSITYHFSDILAWEILHGQGYFDYRSGLRVQLEDNFGVPAQRFPVLRYVADSNFVVSPIYAKLGLLNHNLVYLQFYGVLGGGLGLVYGGEPPAGSTDPGRGLHVAALGDVGIGIRLWLSPRWSLRYDLREYLSVDTATASVSWPLFMSLSIAVSVGGRR